MHELRVDAPSTAAGMPDLRWPTPSAPTPSAARHSAPAARSTDVMVQLADGDRFMDGWNWAAELAQATRATLRLVSILRPMPDVRDPALIDAWMRARHSANARLTAALLAVRRRHPAVHVTSQLCTEGTALLVPTRRPCTDIVVLSTL